MIDDFTIQKVKDSARIMDVVSDYVSLKRQGSEFTGLCPFHADRHAGNFMVSPSKNFAHCFVCDETYDPIEFIKRMEDVDFLDAIRLLAKKYGIYIDEKQQIIEAKADQRPAPKPQPPKPKRYWPLDWVGRYMADGSDNLVRWINSLPWDGAQRARIKPCLESYAVGHSHFDEKNPETGKMETHDFTMFWQIDEQFRVCNAHFMKYKEDGHRIKDKDQYPTTWLHARMKRSSVGRFDEDKEEKAFCLFGLHRMVSNPNAVINIVESEKTAIIMSIAYGCTSRQIWMACYGLGNLTNKNELLRPLIEANRRIVLYPDHDGVEDWIAAKNMIGYKNLSVKTDPVTKWWVPEDGDRADIADIVIRSMRQGSPPTKHISEVMQQMCKDNPKVKTLIDKLNLVEL